MVMVYFLRLVGQLLLERQRLFTVSIIKGSCLHLVFIFKLSPSEFSFEKAMALRGALALYRGDLNLQIETGLSQENILIRWLTNLTREKS